MSEARKLSSMDASFLYLETPEMPMHVGSMAIFRLPDDYKGDFFEEFKAMIAARLHIAPILKSRLEKAPLDIDHPSWVEDDQFDIAFSTAVIEHVGDRERQTRFIAELLRVSKRFFVTTPNRWYPVELHTYVPFLHWLPQHQHQQMLQKLGKDQWATTENLNLLDRRSLRALFPAGVTPTITGTRLFGLHSNLLAFGTSAPSS